MTETAARIGLPWLTLYAFSLENSLRRPRAEVSFLMRLLKTYLDDNVERMVKNNIRLRYIGRTHDLPDDVQDRMRAAEEATSRNTGTTLTLALNYGARSEMVDAFRRLAEEVQHKHLNPAHITEEDIHRHLYTAHMPDPDLLIRTSGELRVSNFLLWQIAYTEIFVTERYWPDFRGIHLLEAIADFQRRERRYGGIGESCGEVGRRSRADEDCRELASRLPSTSSKATFAGLPRPGGVSSTLNEKGSHSTHTDSARSASHFPRAAVAMAVFARRGRGGSTGRVGVSGPHQAQRSQSAAHRHAGRTPGAVCLQLRVARLRSSLVHLRRPGSQPAGLLHLLQTGG